MLKTRVRRGRCRRGAQREVISATLALRADGLSDLRKRLLKSSLAPVAPWGRSPGYARIKSVLTVMHIRQFQT
jgi:hypothetical protein